MHTTRCEVGEKTMLFLIDLNISITMSQIICPRKDIKRGLISLWETLRHRYYSFNFYTYSLILLVKF